MMKSAFACTLILILAAGTSFAAMMPASAVKAVDIRIPVGQTGKFINLQELSTIKVADFEQLTGKKMGLIPRMGFKLAQRRLRHSINPDGTMDSRDPNSFHFGGFALGFFLNVYGVLIAYLIRDKYHRRRVLWAWVGCGIVFLLTAVLIVAATVGGGRR
jgi:hypothetical protein